MPRNKLSKKERADRLQALYDRQNAYAREKYRAISLKLERSNHADVITKLETVPNKLDYIVRLIRADIAENGMDD